MRRRGEIIGYADGNKTENTYRQNLDNPGDDDKQYFLQSAEEVDNSFSVCRFADVTDGYTEGYGHQKNTENATIDYRTQNIVRNDTEDIPKIFLLVAQNLQVGIGNRFLIFRCVVFR